MTLAELKHAVDVRSREASIPVGLLSGEGMDPVAGGFA
ncbi:hypothetical protein RISK_003422 [Rhodopirellula islandica]|uniref:Uncharacterized protein n=1 Tax=Rhodopirellula islandica TaxID=595434 RepID=A0A0J1BCR2_RHOIS|nr:hypothetical protein RISK_003422 [Rhodopirellula islandica]